MIFIQNFYKFFFHYLKFYSKMQKSLAKMNTKQKQDRIWHDTHY